MMKERTKAFMTELIERHPSLQARREAIERGYALLHECYSSGNKVLTCGNGGSAADSEHIVGELMKGFRLKRPLTPGQREALRSKFPSDYTDIADNLQRALPAISLVSQVSLTTAFVNDVAAEMVFAQQVLGYGQPGDLLVAISTSGRSKNVVNAVKVASSFGLASMGLTGESEGPLSELCTVTIRAPARDTAAVQEYHLMIYHALCAMIENELLGDG